jgi:short-chain fatty acids transporter
VNLLETFSRAGNAVSNVAERYIPDAWVVCMVLTAITLVLAVFGAGAAPLHAVTAWGNGLWGLLPITMQFSISVFAAYACAMSRPGFRLLDQLARLPNPDKPVQAVFLLAVVTTITGLLNWALCFVISALMIPFVARRNPNADIRVLCAAAFMGVGTVTNAALSGSAPIIMATPDNPMIKPAVGHPIVDRLYPITETVFSNYNLMLLALLSVISIIAICALHPRGDTPVVTLDKDKLDSILPQPPSVEAERATPASWLENRRIWCYLAGIMLLITLVDNVVTKGFARAWNINAYNTLFLGIALLLHGNPLSFVQAIRRGLDSSYGIVLQFPFYGGIFGLMTGTDLGHWLTGLFVSFSNQQLFPLVVYIYSGIMDLFIPSAGSKWIIEAPYLIPAARELGVSVATTMTAYMHGGSLTNLIHPYMAIPIVAITGVRFGRFAGYGFLVGVPIGICMLIAMYYIPHNL